MTSFSFKNDIEIKPTQSATGASSVGADVEGQNITNASSTKPNSVWTSTDGQKSSTVDNSQTASYTNISYNQLSDSDKLIVDYAQIIFDKNSRTDEKYFKLFDNFFSDNPSYNSLTDTQKKEFIKNKIEEFKNLFNQKGFDFTKAKGNIEIIATAVLLLMVKTDKNISMESLQKMDHKQIVDLAFNKIFEHYDAILAKFPDFVDKSAINELYKISYIYNSVTDSEFVEIPEGKEKDDRVKKTASKLVSDLLGTEIDLGKLENSTFLKSLNIIDFLKFLVNEEHINISDIKGMPPTKILQMMVEYIREKIIPNESDPKIKKNLEQSIELINARLSLITECQKKGIDKPTEQDLYNILKQKPESELSDIEKRMLESYKAAEDIFKKTKDPDFDLSKLEVGLKSPFVQQAILGIKVPEDLIIFKLQSLDPNDPEYTKKAEEIIGKTIIYSMKDGSLDADTKDLLDTKIRIFLKNSGIDEETINQICDKIPSYFTTGDKQSFMTHMTLERGDKLAGIVKRNPKIAKPVNEAVATHGTKNTNKGYAEGIADDHDLTKDYYRVINNVRSADFVKDIVAHVAKSNKVSDEDKRFTARSAVETTDDIERKMYYSQELAKINNTAVTQGLMDAAESISDPDVRAQYVTNVETYSAQAAYETSQTTVAQTSSYASSSNPTDKMAASFEQQGLKPASCSSQEIVNAYLAYNDSTTQELENKKAKALENADKTTKKIKKDQAQREEQIEEKKSKDPITTLKAILSNKNEQEKRSLIVNYIRFGNSDAIRELIENFPNNYEILALIAQYSYLPEEQIAKMLRVGKLSPSYLSNIRSFASNYRTDRTILEGLYAYTKDITILAYNMDLLKEYISKGRISIAELQAYPELYERYINSLTDLERSKFENKQDPKASNFNDESKTRFAAEQRKAQEQKEFREQLAHQGETGRGMISSDPLEEKDPADLLSKNNLLGYDPNTYKRRKKQKQGFDIA